MAIKTIIFDIGGVIVNSFGNELIDNASKHLQIKPSELRKFMDVYEPSLQKGLITEIDFWKKIINKKHSSVPPDSILKGLWIEIYEKTVKIDSEMIKFIKQLKKDYIIGCISNSIKSHTEFNRKRGLYKYFSSCILSDEVKIRKPDEKIFRLYLKKADCKPSEAIFIDDEKQLLVNAEKIGIHVIQFRNIKQLKKELAIIISKK